MNCPLSSILLRKKSDNSYSNELEIKSQPFSVQQRTLFMNTVHHVEQCYDLTKAFLLRKEKAAEQEAPVPPQWDINGRVVSTLLYWGQRNWQRCSGAMQGPIRGMNWSAALFLRTHPEAWLFYSLSNELCPGRAKSYHKSEEIFHLSSFVENPNVFSFFKCQVKKRKAKLVRLRGLLSTGRHQWDFHSSTRHK